MDEIVKQDANVANLQVLAVDLLNPSAASEARKHKLKVRYENSSTLRKLCWSCFG